MWRTLLSQLDAHSKLEWAKAFLDGSFVPAKKGAMRSGNQSGQWLESDGGRRRPELAHWAVCGKCPTSREPAGGSRLATICVPQPRGRPRTHPQELVADKAYDSQAFRRYLPRRGMKPTIPPVARRHRKRLQRGRPVRTGPSYRQRWKVERRFGWMDNNWHLVVRYERYVEHYKAFCLLAIILWCVHLILKYFVQFIPSQVR
jgi:Transposase DDE domain